MKNAHGTSSLAHPLRQQPTPATPPGGISTIMPRVHDTLPELDLGVKLALDHAITHKQPVLAVLHAEPQMGRAVRTIHGVPVGFRATRDGRARVVFSIADGTEQIVVFERIERIIPR